MTSRSSAGRAPDDDPSTSAAIVVDDAMSPTELAHEEIVLRNPGDVEAWRAYLDAMAREANDATTSGRWAKKRALIHERAVRHNPNSYKLWFFYLLERVDDVRGLRCDDVCLLYTSPSPRDKRQSRMPSSA